MGHRAPKLGGRTTLLGRADECALLDGLAGDIRGGESRSLVLRGEAGVGKTALLEYLIESASDLMVVRAVGVEAEMELAFAGLHQLCAPLLDRLPRLPAPQREALETVFGLRTGAAPDRFLAALGVLSLFSEVAEALKKQCVVDDAQWLDQASALTLAFVARRLLAEAVGIVIAAREPGEEFGHRPELEVHGLHNDDARALLDSAVPFKLDELVRDRIIAETRGNPLGLLELPRGLTAMQLAGGFGLMGGQALTGKIEYSFARRLEALDEEARLLLVLAAAEPTGDPLLLRRAAERLGIGPAAAEAAEAPGLLEISERVRFRHPLVRSAVYRSAAVQQRRTVHLVLAEATDRELDSDRRAWHLAAAAPGPDEDVAIELERSAGRAQARGGLAAAAAFLQRAVALTQDTDRRAERALAAGEATLQAGAFDVVLGLLSAAEAGRLDAMQRARLDLLRAQLAFAQSRGSDAPPLLIRAAKTLEQLDPKLARETYLDAWSAALFAGRFAHACNLEEVSREARVAAPAPQPARPSDLLLDGYALLLTDGRAAATPFLRQAVKAFAGEGASVEEVLRWGWLATVAAVIVWDYESCVAVAARGVQLARDSGALTVLAVALNIMAQAVALGGEFRRAAQLISEADAVTEATGTPVLRYAAIYVSGYQGREGDVAKLVDATVPEATAGGQGNAVQFVSLAKAVVANGLGRYREALAPAQDASEDMPELVVSMWALIELVEAASRSGEMELARSAVDRLAARNDVGANDWSLGVEARSRALVSEGVTADELYREAITRLSRTRLRPELARAHLLYGEWLRREGRRVDARTQLRPAHEQFTSMGMEAFAERSRRELLATGEKARKRTVETRDDLTPQERQIAQLARDGLSNPEIGARLFLSPRTVEWHLRKVFGKLGIRSRHELANGLARVESDLAQV
ncbi:MAG: AAA family ATPase [Solirubrobacterales bacterium]|nr:AAA family ATPase [Solirubrobacterales bacterium]